MSSVPFLAKPIITVRDAIACHVRWKVTLLTAARMHEPLTAPTTRSIRHPEECPIRQWLLANRPLPLRRSLAYRALLNRHAKFYREMQTIASLIAVDEFAAAERLLTAHGSFEHASLAVADAIVTLEAALKAALERVPLHKLAS